MRTMVGERAAYAARLAGRKGGLLRGLTAAVLALLLALGAWTGAVAADGDSAAAPADAPAPAQIDLAVGALQASLAKAEPLGDWTAFALARGGKAAPNRYLAEAAKSITPDNLRLVTDYARFALALNANGGDARQAGAAKINLLKKIANAENMTKQGPNAPAFALMALDAGGYVAAADDLWTRESLIRWLIGQRAADGGWSLVPGKSDVDVTGIVLTALAPYQDREDVKPAVDGALAWLSSVQLENGGFGSPETSESAVQTIIALTSLGIDPAADSRFVKNGRSVLSRFMDFRLPDGTFSHVPGGKSDSLASLYALLGLTAVDRWQDGLPGLYAGLRADRAVKLTVYGPEGKLAEGAAAGRTAMEDLVQVLQAGHVRYTVKRDPQFGPFLTSIGSYANGKFGGYDGWQYAVRKDGKWDQNVPGMSAYDPAGASEIVVYYGESPALIHAVTTDPVKPREGRPITVAVEKETYDWSAGKTAVGPAEGAKVTIGGVSAVTDKDDKAVLEGVKAGATTLKIDGYRPGAAPKYVEYEQPFTVASYVKRVTVRVEGDQRPIAEGKAEGGTALEALDHLLKAKNMTYEVKELSFGKYVSSIAGVAAAQYGGFDGWMFAVKDGSSWIYPMESIDTFLLEDGQELVVYYGGENTTLADPVSVTPARAKPGEPVTVKVTRREMNRTTNALGPSEPLAGVQVAAAGLSAVTNENGEALLPGLPEGIHTVAVTGYAQGTTPSVVRTTARLTVAGDYSDQAKIAGWSLDWIRSARASGVLLGTGDQKTAAFKPKAAVTRAEFVSAIVRALGIKPASSGAAFGDVPAQAWYAKEIEAAAQAGLVAGVAPGKFAPEARLTREQAAQLLARALKLQAAGTVTFADSAQVSAGAKASVEAVLGQGWMTVQADGRFLPKTAVTREQAAVIAVRVLFRDGNGMPGK